MGVEFVNVEKRYGARFALRSVSLKIDAGECVALIGHNGSGKTTLLKTAALLVRPNSGSVQFLMRGSMATNGNADSVKPYIGFVSHSTLLYDELTAEENLVLFARLYRLQDAERSAGAALGPAGLGGRGADLVRTFSRGMRQRLAIARALLISPRLLLLDEPTTGLDPAGQQWFAETLRNLLAQGCTIMMSTHGPTDAHALVTRAVRLVSGAVTDDSSSAEDARRLLVSTLAAEREA